MPESCDKTLKRLWKGHCEHPQDARRSHGNGEIAALPPALRSGLRLTAVT